MDLSKYRLERATLGPEWDAAVDRSAEGSLFVKTAVLSCLEAARPGLWSVKKDRQPVAILGVVESEDGRSAVENDFVIYAGLMFEPAPNEQSAAQITAEKFRIACFCAEQLPSIYDDVFLAMSPNLADIRPMLWLNYQQPGAHYTVDVRFTSTIVLDPASGPGLEDDPLYLSASKSRRQQIRYGRGKNVVTEQSRDVATFAGLYERTMARQGKEVNEAALRQMTSISSKLIESGQGQLYVTRTADGTVGSAAVFGWDSKRAYYVYGANNPDLRDDHTGTMVLWDALTDLRQRGIAAVDLEGVNSPLRGHFKLSFGGDIKPYYHLRIER